MKLITTWTSETLGSDVTAVRWGEIGVPVLIFPTAGGDAEEIERFLVVDTLADYLTDGRIKVYSCDSIAGRVMLGREGTPEHRMRMLNRFQSFVYSELVPAIRQDCNDPDIEIVVAGSSIGAFNALAAVCRFPDVFSHALCMSGTYDLRRFLINTDRGSPKEVAWVRHGLPEAELTDDFYFSSPTYFLPDLQGEQLADLRRRFVLLASGRGRAEDIDESWRVTSLLGEKQVPNRMDDWGEEWHHDWPTWRAMLLQYIDELVPPAGDSAGD